MMAKVDDGLIELKQEIMKGMKNIFQLLISNLRPQSQQEQLLI
jgi:hypothetical protein